MEGHSSITRVSSSTSLAQDICVHKQKAHNVATIEPHLTLPQENLAKAKRTGSLEQLSIASTDPYRSTAKLAIAKGPEEKHLQSRIQLLQFSLGFIQDENQKPLDAILEQINESLINLMDSRNTKALKEHLPELIQLEQSIRCHFNIHMIDCWHEYAALLYVIKGQLESPNRPRQTVQVGDYTVQLASKESAQYFRESIEGLFEMRRSALKKLREEKPQDKQSEIQIRMGIEGCLNRSYNQVITTLMGEALGSQRKARNISLTPNDRLKLPEEDIKKLGESPYAKPFKEGDLSVKERAANTIPLSHTQLVLNKKNGHSIRLCTNHIYINGKHAGMIMQAPRPDELELVISAILDEQIIGVLDLTSSNGRALCNDTSRDSYDPVLEWQFLEDRHETDSYILEVVKRDSVDWGERQKYYVFFKTFNVVDKTSQKCLHTFTSMNFANWPDRSGLHPYHMEALVDEVNKALAEYSFTKEKKPILINCLAGLGRSSSFAAASNIIEDSERIDVQGWELGQLALNAILHLRLSRSGEAVQTLTQAYGLLHLETLMQQERMKPTVCEQEAQMALQ
ncbi:hypothetical protein M3P05_18980 [Sansalvadorimonas sp. 2012CJ34-2]|uniref:Tyrosine specific protein phosphatases domain-containing protein n=1 Tax=Parendozoicomonas callyspongiae TaxID=2942213 RepID=A0ABT0PKW8_9GAMM|nr:protein-tyrosine phosphatase family protein [Sansalvadorimonas sp. 2012CJ34-2]MCL6272009.1 hypothetical protein [Sansalvadorimonas sp. 2012CJ34-2]